MAENEIVVNQLFSGGYLDEKGNIGHEVINFFDDDEGNRYLYIPPKGTLPDCRKVETVVFVRNIWAWKTVEVIAIAQGLSSVGKEEVSSIRYGGVPLDRIFRKNTYHGEEDKFSGHVTFRANEVKIPANNSRIFLTLDKQFCKPENSTSIFLNSEKNALSNRKMKSYFSHDEDPDAYEKLRSMIENDKLWTLDGEMGALIADGSAFNQRPSFLEIIRKENDELTFSNLLAYYFDFNHEAFTRFAKQKSLLDIPKMDADFSITREKKNIDLWIESNEHIIVIENKIKSGINGIDEAGKSQLDKYQEYAQKEARKSGKALHFYLFVPDYSNIDFKKYNPSGLYKEIPYSAIYEFFVKNVSSFFGDQYFTEFLRALKRQTMTTSELNFETMRSRFLMQIAHAQ